MRRESEKSSSTTSNGTRYHGNGSLHSQKGSESSNGHAHTNGSESGNMNGSSPLSRPVLSPNFHGHSREEVTRLLIQALGDLGYRDSANHLIRESGYELESPSVAAFRMSILNGEWAEAEALLFGTNSRDEGGVSISNGHSSHHQGLPLADGVDKDSLRFVLRKQKYLELLEERDHGRALMVLRQELTPLDQDIAQLHSLSGYVVCPTPKDLRLQAGWDGAKGNSRSMLLSELSQCISPSVMIPDHRLATLLDQVTQSQISKCHYHNPTTSPSLFSNHLCDRSQFPLQTVHQLTQNSEIWFLQFSHDGTKLATCGREPSVVIYETENFHELHKLSEHTHQVTNLAWSPDDNYLITCSHDRTAKMWDTLSGRCLYNIQNHREPLTSACWTPDGQSFITGSLDRESALNMWTSSAQKSHTWATNYRVTDLAVSPDGQRLVTISSDRQVFVYNLRTMEEEYSLRLKTELTCINISRDSKYMLVSMADNELQLIEIDTSTIEQRFIGHKQSQFVIRSAFGGADENLVISGSEDGKIYIFHKERGTVIETLEGHGEGCVNAVAWNHANPCMFASAGDDNQVRIWSKPIIPRSSPQSHRNGYQGTSFVRGPTYGATTQLL